MFQRVHHVIHDLPMTWKTKIRRRDLCQVCFWNNFISIILLGPCKGGPGILDSNFKQGGILDSNFKQARILDPRF